MLTLLPALLATAPAAASPTGPLVLADIAWRAEPGRAGAPRLTLTRNGSSSNGVAMSERLANGRTLGALLRQPGDGAVSFGLAPEAGRMTCSGTVRAGGGAGRCRFTSSQAFEAGLTARAIPLKRRDQLFDLALVGATLARADGLSREGFPMRNADDLAAATALDVTGAYARELRSAGLAIRSFNDLIACRALKIDGNWVNGFARAGYRLDARRAIAMKATGVTPDYARQIREGGAK